MRSTLAKLGWVILLLVSASLGIVKPAEASHFRYGTLSWVPTGTPGEVEFRLIGGFRRSGYPGGSAPDGFPRVGDVITETVGATSLDFGDSTSTPTLRFIVTAFSVTEDWIIGQALQPSANTPGIRHTYSGPGPFLALVFNGNRIVALNNRANGLYRLETIVLPLSGNSSAVSTQVPVVTVPESSTASFFVPAADANGDTLRWRLSTDAEAGGGPSPPGLSVNPSTGQVTWNNVGLNQTQFWTVQIVVEDLDSGGNVKSKTPVDFLLGIVPAVGQPPSCMISPMGPITVLQGTPVSFTVTGTDPDVEDSVTLNTSGLPVGATMTPSLPVTGGSSVSSTFNWIPTSAQAGATIVLFTVTDANGQQAQCAITINVIRDVAPPCIALTAVIPGPPRQLRVSAQDVGTGLGTFTLRNVTNFMVSVAPYTLGTTSPVPFTATRVNPTLNSWYEILTRDLANNETNAVAAILTIPSSTARTTSLTLTGMTGREDRLTIRNGNPGMTGMDIFVNSTRFLVLGLRPGELRRLDISSALMPGFTNVIMLTATGFFGANVEVVINH